MNAHTAKIFENLRQSRLDSAKENEQKIPKKINEECNTKQKNGPGTSDVSASIPNNERILCPSVSENQLEAQSLVEIVGSSSRGPTCDCELASNKRSLSDSSSDNYNPEEDSTSSSSSCSSCSSSSDSTSESEDQNEITDNKLSKLFRKV
ncbi:uncharacterized protein [Diabrotica undecimpunctata]|uniref:uncharacterized protein n=1 Tax=Diabrotica undecimpunctata TaxID=50387 RepID=UPI003B63D314